MFSVSSPRTFTFSKLRKSTHERKHSRSSSEERSTYKNDFSTFLATNPSYETTSELDRLRRVDFTRLERSNEVYVDYMGGCLWPESLVTGHASLLKDGLFGNTHSDSPCANRSDHHIATARKAVLEFFDAPSSDYVCIFTANATNALKLVGESFPFTTGSKLIIPADCHNSVNGLRRFAEDGGATVDYLEAGQYGGFKEQDALALLTKHKSENVTSPSLFVVTGQSNITGIRPSLSILADAKDAGFATLIDAAALASSTRISMQQLPHADAMAVSFYKMFGYPTGVGALIAKKSFLEKLSRAWFSGGSVDFVQAPGKLTLHAKDLTARFEEGTLNYSALSAIAPGLKLLGSYMSHMSTRLPILHQHLHTALESLVYPGTQTPLVRVHTRPRDAPLQRSPSGSSMSSGSDSGSSRAASPRITSPTRAFRWMVERASSLRTPPMSPVADNIRSPFSTFPPAPSTPSQEAGQGYVVSCTFYTSTGEVIPLSQVSRLASASGISLRTGCVCNPGGSAALRGKVIQDRMDELSKFDDNVELSQICTLVGGLSSAGIVRLSLGMVSNFEDVWKVVNWARGLLDETKRAADLERLMQ